MEKWLFIAREKINGITDDSGLKALNGYGKIVFEIPYGKSKEDVFDEAVKAVNDEYPNRHFREYEWKEIQDS